MEKFILGVHNGFDSGACILHEGKLLEAVSEERFSRIKLFVGIPTLSFDYLRRKYTLRPDNIETIVYSRYTTTNNYPEYLAKLVPRIVQALDRDPHCGPLIAERIKAELADEQFRREFVHWMGTFGIRPQQISFLDHHAAHAWSAYSCSPFENALVITADGRGDLKSASVSRADMRTGITECHYELTLDSVGFLYGQITHFLGFRPHRDEGKITGLAAYGNPAKTSALFKRLLDWEDGRMVSSLGLYQPHNRNTNPALRGLFESFSREDVAAGLQDHCENVISAFVQHWRDRVGQPHAANICLAGGVFANVKINQRIAELPGVENVFVFPHMGDGGLIVGGVCQAHFHRSGRAKIDFPTAFLGPEFSDDEIEEAFREHPDKIVFERVEDVVQATVEELLGKRIVGFFSGRMEFGPRALGARSILVHAQDRTINDWLNKRLNRTEFMPFAPVTPVEYGSECYQNWRPDHVAARFMTRTYKCTKEFLEKHPAVVHVDETARPQIVDAERDGTYYAVVKEYCRQTGLRALVNTSFNAHEEPIICTPREALASLLQDRVDVLMIGPYRVRQADRQ